MINWGPLMIYDKLMFPAFRARHLILPALLLVTAGCAKRGIMDLPPSQRLYAELQAVLGREWPSSEYQRARLRLQQMGPEVDSVLVEIIRDPGFRVTARADALVLLADRGSSLALPTLRSTLQSDIEVLRSASVLGLNQLAQSSDQAMELIRLAAEDRSRNVRLNALQSLDIDDVATIRRLLAQETDDEVRAVGLQLVSLAESRGAPLAEDRHGVFRTASSELQPSIVFRPVTADVEAGIAWGDLRVELPANRDIPLAASASVVGNVLPAFFSPDRSAVVTEVDGEIRVVDIQSRTVRSLGRGIAPRLIPFTPRFVFVRENLGSRRHTAEATEIEYTVFQGSFTAPGTEMIGTLAVRALDDVRGGESPVRWMVVTEGAEDGFALRGDNMDSFPLPAPVWSTATKDEPLPPGTPIRD